MTHVLRPILIASLALATLAACGDDAAPPKAAETPTAPATIINSAANLAEAAEARRIVAQPKPDLSVPLAQYETLQSGNQLMFQYYARSGLPLDHATVAKHVSSEYARTNDTFRQRDLLNALKPRIDASLAQAAANPYLRLDIGNETLLSAYDFTRKGFSLRALEGGSYRYFHDNSTFRLSFSNTHHLELLPVADEALAREIETLRAKYASMSLQVYAFAHDSDTSSQAVKALITHLVLTDNQGRALLRYDVPASALAPKQENVTKKNDSPPPKHLPYGIY